MRSSTDEGSREIAAVQRYLDGSFANSPALATATSAGARASVGSAGRGGAANVSVGLDVEQLEEEGRHQQQGKGETKRTSKHAFHGVSVPGWNFL